MSCQNAWFDLWDRYLKYYSVYTMEEAASPILTLPPFSEMSCQDSKQNFTLMIRPTLSFFCIQWNRAITTVATFHFFYPTACKCVQCVEIIYLQPNTRCFSWSRWELSIMGVTKFNNAFSLNPKNHRDKTDTHTCVLKQTGDQHGMTLDQQSGTGIEQETLFSLEVTKH